jgi:hypothetical protein
MSANSTIDGESKKIYQQQISELHVSASKAFLMEFYAKYLHVASSTFYAGQRKDGSGLIK